MSIFRSSFSPTVQNQLNYRQQAIVDRGVKALQYINGRNAWIRMQSSVNVDGSNALAKAYILQGGTLNEDYSKKEDVGASFTKAYSNRAYDGTSYRRGIRPMPGITGIEVKSKTAYGSLREVVVSFQCWDIQQLEDLELLYMRPGYTVLVEWGWAPYIDKNGEYQPAFTSYYDIINKPQTDRTTLFKDLYNKSVDFGGNYDAMFGYVKNYSWSARPDGGYDCQTTVISTGEIIESLKVNYLLPGAITTAADGLLKDEFKTSTSTQWIDKYSRNVLAGMWAEFYYKYLDVDIIKGEDGKTNSAINYAADVFQQRELYLTSTNPNPDSLVGSTGIQLYITLSTVLKLLNKYITAKSSTDGKSLVELSLLSNEYEGTPTDLLCVSHPLQVSVDPSVCIIKSPSWYEDGGVIIQPSLTATTQDPIFLNTQDAFDDIKEGWTYSFGTDEPALLRGIKKIKDINTLVAVNDLIANDPDAKEEGYKDLQDILNGELNLGDLGLAINIRKHFKQYGIEVKVTSDAITDSFNEVNPENTLYSLDVAKIEITVPPTSPSIAQSQATIAAKASSALSNLQFLKDIPYDYFYGNKNGFDEIGTLKNIYVNVNYLFLKSLDSNLESSDPNNKNEINLYNYLKAIISDIQASIGNINNFEIHVDPISNNVARIIDVNYTESPKAKYKNLFELKLHTTNSVVRSYQFQSQIFPNQSALVAISSQVKGGQLGIQNNTLIDFNRSLTDRIIPEKVDGSNSPQPTVNNNKPTVTNGVAQIINLFDSINKTDTNTDYNELASKAKNSLRDLIGYFQTIVKSPGSNRNIIPTKFSCDMDGIGGFIIGHMFRLPKSIIPRGYRGEGAGVEVAQAVTSISHTIQNGDWVTKIDSLNMVLSDPLSDTSFSSLDLSGLKDIAKKVLVFERQNNAAGGGVTALQSPNPNISISPPSAEDIAIYKAILKGIGAPESDENLKLFYAWRTGEGGSAAWNPFNTTYVGGTAGKPEFKVTPYNCNAGYPVKNYASKQDGINATIKTLKLGYYDKIRNGLINNVGAATISTYVDEFRTWGTGIGVNSALAGQTLAPPAIVKQTTKVATC